MARPELCPACTADNAPVDDDRCSDKACCCVQSSVYDAGAADLAARIEALEEWQAIKWDADREPPKLSFDNVSREYMRRFAEAVSKLLQETKP